MPKELSGYDHDKYYVGITSKRVKVRWGNNGSGYSRQPLFKNVIDKYGWHNIDHDIIAENLTKQEACDMERKLIKKLNSNNKNHGYNLTNGGEGSCGLVMSERAKHIISIKNTGKKRTPEQIQHIKESRPDWSFDNHPNSKKIYQFSMDGIFIEKYLSLAEAEQKTGLRRSGISHSALYNGTCGNFLWLYEDNILSKNNTFYIKEFKYKHPGENSKKEIFQFSKDGTFIKKYSSLKEAEKESGIRRTTISNHINNRVANINDSRIKYIWKLAKDVKESEENPGSFFIA